MCRIENSKMVEFSENDSLKKYRNDYICDTATDLPNTDNLVMGSSAIVIDESKVYVVDGEGDWVELGGE